MKEKKMVTVHVGNGGPMAAQNFNRNALCRCGSGKKTKYFYIKPSKNDGNTENTSIESDKNLETLLTD